jgi:hypothetical protein
VESVSKAINPLDLHYEPALREFRADRTSPPDFLTGEIDELRGDDE